MTTPAELDQVRERVRARYAQAADTVLAGESFRVLRPGGRLGVSDILAEDHLTPAERAERGGPIGCIAGALSIAEYHDGLTEAGFTAISISPTHEVATGLHSAIIRAVKA